MWRPSLEGNNLKPDHFILNCLSPCSFIFMFLWCITWPGIWECNNKYFIPFHVLLCSCLIARLWRRARCRRNSGTFPGPMLSIPPGKHLNVYPRGWCVCDQYIVSVHSHVLCTEKTRLSHTLYCTLLSFVTQTGLVVSAVFTTALLKSFAMNDHIFSLICNPPWTMTFIKYHKKKKKPELLGFWLQCL